ncbi:MAG: putative transporter [Methanoregulaceae archaeon PtaU1.Bin059]|nr:MAG: putative transporter [Methanoregulaceae archaeon PtaB.Bin009]OPY39725.1 MAG: putative transporter [Methanoregulaceae archaeon PtaU1.Bin059]HNQ30379.1 MFS transporter [Methanolinea sp.]
MTGRREKRTLLFVSSLASFLVPYTVSSLNIALPAISGAFGLDAVTLGWVTSAYMLTAAVCIVPFGKIADIYGRKRVFLVGNLLFVAGSVFAAVSWAGYALVAARIVQGLGGAMVFSTSIAIITAVFSPGERGRAIGIVTATVYAGLSLGPFLGGILTQHAGWPSIFLLNVPLGVAVIALTLTRIPGEWADLGQREFDLAGSVLYGLMLIGCIYGLTLLPSTSGLIWMSAGLVLLLAFWWWEHRSPHPVLDPALFSKNHVFLYSNLAALINYAMVFAVGFLLSLYLQFNRGLDPQTAGIFLVAQPVVQTLVSPAAGHLSDSIDPRVLATAGMAFSTAGLGILAFLSTDTPLVVILGGLVILGIGYGLFSSPNTNAIMSSVGVHHLGIASGMVSTMRAIGQMVSLAIAMVVFSVVIGTVQISPAVYPELQQSVNLSFSVFFVLGLIGIWASYTRGNTHIKK